MPELQRMLAEGRSGLSSTNVEVDSKFGGQDSARGKGAPAQRRIPEPRPAPAARETRVAAKNGLDLYA